MVVRSVRTKISFAFFSMLIAASLAFGVSGYLLIKKYLLDAEQSKLEISARYMAETINQTVSTRMELFRIIPEDRRFRDFLLTYRTSLLQEYFSALSEEFPVLSLLNEYGEEEVKTVNGRPSSRFREMGGGELFMEAVGHPDTVVVRYAARSPDLGEYAIAMAMASTGDGSNSVDSVLYGEIPMSEISRLMERFSAGKPVFFHLVTSDGKVVAQSSDAMPLLSRNSTSRQMKRFISGEEKFARTDMFGMDCLVAAVRTGNSGMTMLASVPYAVFMSGPDRMILYMVMIVCVILLCGTALSPLISRDIIKPVRLLAASAGKVARGDFASHVEVTSSDELGSLAESFNIMIDRLSEFRNSLIKEKGYTDEIIRSMLNALFVTDGYMEIVRVNEAACRMLGIERKKLEGRHISSIFSGELAWEEFADKVFKNRGEFIETVLRTQDGMKVPVIMSGSGMGDEGDHPEGFVFVAQDISEIKTAQELLKSSHSDLEIKIKKRTDELATMNKHLQQEIAERNRAEEELVRINESLERRNEELQEFLFIASHDLQEPLRKIRAFSDRLMAKYSGSLDERGTDYLRRMSSSAGRMQRLISGLLEFSRVTTDERKLQPVDLNEIVQDVISDLEVSIEQSGGLVDVSPLATIEADSHQMRQLFLNLIGNALKYRKEDVPPVVKVRGMFEEGNGNGKYGSGTLYRIVVEDNGIGFDEKYLDRIFRVFQRLHNMNEYEGTGIGLALCRKIVERHGGEITARSRPGEGSSFIVTLPVRQSLNGHAAEAEGTGIPHG
jgi:PAS domain S-box-containing protein